ncbi:MAG: ABC transporter ATP-binding protein [Candidatus Omnitrophota bacterium]
MKQDMRDYFRLLKFMRPHMFILLVASGSMLIYSLLNSISPIALLPIIDNFVSGKKITINPYIKVPGFITGLIDKVNAMDPMRLLSILIVGGLVYFLLRNLFDFMQMYFMNDVSQRVIRDIKDALYKKMLSLSMNFYSKNPTAKLMSRITYDAAIVRDAISTGLLDLILRPLEIISHFIVVVGIVLVSGIPLKFLVTSILLFPCILIPAVIISKRLRQISTKTQEKMGDINTILFEIITGIRIVKAFSMQDYECKKFSDQNRGFYKLEMKQVKRVNMISPINEFTSAVYLAAVLYIAGRQIADGTLSFGALAVFLTSIFLMLKPIKRLGKVYAIIQTALASAVRIFSILDTEPEVLERDDAVKLPQIRDKIEFKDVWFKYIDDYVLKGINLTVKKGDIVAIVGPSGAGKTSLVNLVGRFYDASRGVVSIDGVDIREADMKSVRDQIGIVTQEMLLFNDTVMNNISYGSEGHTREDIIKAAKIANAHNFIMGMPEQYDTVIGEKGFRLSGGEKQRISIARAIFKNPPILIFDEATSQLDTESERLVQEAIDRLMEGRTVFVIAHRLSTITHANKIIVLEAGCIVEEGAHKQLMAGGGLYKYLYELQFARAAV